LVLVHGGAFDGIVRLDTAFADPADPRQMQSIDLSLFASRN
jgi:hypothetical protein